MTVIRYSSSASVIGIEQVGDEFSCVGFGYSRVTDDGFIAHYVDLYREILRIGEKSGVMIFEIFAKIGCR